MIPYRDDNPTRTFPFVTIGLIAMNVLVFLNLAFKPGYEEIVMRYGFLPGRWQPETFITSMFLHAGIEHLVFNMWYLWLFGDNLEDGLGHGRFLVFYLLGGLVALLLHSIMVSGAAEPVPCIGASGAISAVMGGYVTLFPRANIHVLWIFFYSLRVFKLSAIYFLGFWFLEQLFVGGSSSALGVATGVAYWAHIGGFAYGVVFAWIVKRL